MPLTESIEPAESFEPSKPTNLTESIKPTGLSEPTNLTESSEPAEFFEPTNLTEPSNLTEPITNLTEPSNLTEPTEPITKPTLPSKSSTPLVTGVDSYQPSTDFDEPFVYTSAEVTRDKLVLQATLYGFSLHDHTTIIRADLTIGDTHQLSHVAFSGHGPNREFQRQTTCAMLAAIVSDNILCSIKPSVDQNCYVTLRPHVNLDLEIKEYEQLGFVQVDETLKQGVRLIANIGDVINNSGWAKIDSVVFNPPSPVYIIGLSDANQEALRRLCKQYSNNTSKRPGATEEEEEDQDQQPTLGGAKRHCPSPLL